MFDRTGAESGFRRFREACRWEKEAKIGSGAVITQYRLIGPRAIVGGGAVVIRDVPPDATVAGVPAGALAKTKSSKRES